VILAREIWVAALEMLKKPMPVKKKLAAARKKSPLTTKIIEYEKRLSARRFSIRVERNCLIDLAPTIY
jgi:hypothetical protein